MSEEVDVDERTIEKLLEGIEEGYNLQLEVLLESIYDLQEFIQEKGYTEKEYISWVDKKKKRTLN
jgi:hypothetical protein